MKFFCSEFYEAGFVGLVRTSCFNLGNRRSRDDRTKYRTKLG